MLYSASGFVFVSQKCVENTLPGIIQPLENGESRLDDFSHPALNRMGTDTKLLNQPTNAVALIQGKVHQPHQELDRIEVGFNGLLHSGGLSFQLVLQRDHSPLRNEFLHPKGSLDFLRSV